MEKIKAYKHLKESKPIVFSTDTINGIGCLYDDIKCIESIYKMKNRGEDKPLILFFDSVDMIKEYIKVNEKIMYYVEKYMPGALTIIAKPRKKLNKYLLKDNYTAFRIPNKKDIIELISYIKKPLSTTSLNISKKDIIINEDELKRSFNNYYLFNKLQKQSIPSTIIKINDNIEIIRKGKIKLEV